MKFGSKRFMVANKTLSTVLPFNSMPSLCIVTTKISSHKSVRVSSCISYHYSEHEPNDCCLYKVDHLCFELTSTPRPSNIRVSLFFNHLEGAIRAASIFVQRMESI